MSQGTAFTFGAWIALLGGIWFLFDKSESVASIKTKTAIVQWLQNLDPAGTAASWPTTFAGLFDSVFGQYHFSWRCFWRSCLASWASTGILFAFWGSLRPAQWEQYIGSGFAGPLFAWFLGTLLVNAVPDYCSLLKSRYLIHVIGDRPSPIFICLLLALDIAATLSIYLTGLALFLLAADGISFLLRERVVPLAAVPREIASFVADAVFLTRRPGIPPGVSPGVWFYAAFFTCAWVWLYALSGAAVKLGQYLGMGVAVVRGLLDIEEKPITSLGWAAMLLASIVYWGVALVRWYAAA